MNPLNTSAVRPAFSLRELAHAHEPGPGDPAPSISFGKLDTLLVGNRSGFDFDDDTVSEFALAWLHIRHLMLLKPRGPCDYPISPSPQTIPRTTLRSLQFLGANCPQLPSLYLEMNARSISELSSVPVVKQGLQFLHVGMSPIESPAPVAGYLTGLFPHMSRIGTQIWSSRQ
jgi:hypothetical protein